MPHPQRLSRSHIHHTFDSSNRPVIFVDPGEIFVVETVDCFGGVVSPENPTIVPENHTLNPVTGPIYVHGAEPGDILAVNILDIIPEGVGIARCGSTGQLAKFLKTAQSSSPANMFCPCTRFFDLNEDKTQITMRDYNQDSENTSTNRITKVFFPSSPMLGVIGVAPKGDNVSVPTMPAGMHGGNLDDRYNRKGSIVYITVNHSGALLSIGDMHASQGDGEICGTGVEIRGEVWLNCHVIKKCSVSVKTSRMKSLTQVEFPSPSAPFLYPITETETHWHTHGVTVENIPDTTSIACEEAARLLIGQWGFSIEDAFIFLSVKGNLGLCQSCHPDTGTQIARMSVPKIDACPHPFRCLLDGQSSSLSD